MNSFNEVLVFSGFKCHNDFFFYFKTTAFEDALYMLSGKDNDNRHHIILEAIINMKVD